MMGSGGNLTSTAQRLVDLLSPHTPFAEAIVRRQAERAGKSLSSLEEGDLPEVVPLIETAAQHFVDPPVLAQLKREGGA